MDTSFAMHGDYTPEIQINGEAMVYGLRDYLLSGQRITCAVSHLKTGIGGSSLSRRIKDCKDHLKMNVKAVFKPHRNASGKKVHVKEYYMEPQDIEYYLLNHMGLRITYKSPAKGAKSIAISSYDNN
jgi:hypothetical protein